MGEIQNGSYISQYSGDKIDELLTTTVWQSNKNLLDNWDFSNANNIVDQRGGYILIPASSGTNYYYTNSALTQGAVAITGYTTVYGVTSASGYRSFKLAADGATTYYAALDVCVRGYTGIKYGFDRWINSNTGTVYYDADGHLRFTNSVSLDQRIPLANLKAGQVYTMSVLTDTGVYSYTKTVGNDQWGTFDFGDTGLKGVFTTQASAYNVAAVRVPSGGSFSGYPIAVKLEKGTQQTLAHQENGVWVLNRTQKYGDELRECQRYQLVLNPNRDSYHAFGFGYAATATRAFLYVPVPTTMRISPTTSYTGVPVLKYGNTNISVTDIKTYWGPEPNNVGLDVTVADSTPLTVGAFYTLGYKHVDQGTLILDANL